MHRTHLITRRVDTLITELRNKVRFVDQGGIHDWQLRFVVPGFRNQIDLHRAVFEVDVSLDPRARIPVGHMVLGATSRQAFSGADAFFGIDQKTVKNRFRNRSGGRCWNCTTIGRSRQRRLSGAFRGLHWQQCQSKRAEHHRRRARQKLSARIGL